MLGLATRQYRVAEVESSSLGPYKSKELVYQALESSGEENDKSAKAHDVAREGRIQCQPL